mmetsp:Transcript_7134/g.15461  ORF Transcript_7134/g.15461 Transcript_7134/m.15461 type:complete len:220 (+) Transcript_7134:39-698(+)
MSSEQEEQSTIIGGIMKFVFSSMHSVLYSPVSVTGQSASRIIESSTIANLSTHDRESLVQDIASEINHEEVESSLADLDIILSQCKTSLEAFEKKERFVSLRIDRYRMLMTRREERMLELTDKSARSHHDDEDDANHDHVDDDLENRNVQNFREQLNSLQATHVVDQKRLQGVGDLHKGFIAQIEVLRRRVDDLEEKQEDIMVKRGECEDFLVAAAEFT